MAILTAKANEVADKERCLMGLIESLRKNQASDLEAVLEMVKKNLNTDANELGVLHKAEEIYESAYRSQGMSALLSLL